MPDIIEISPDAERLAEVVAALTTDYSVGQRAVALARLRRQHAKAHTSLQQQGETLTHLYFEALRRNGEADEIESAAKILGERERAAAEKLVPRIEVLQRKLAARHQPLHPELQQACQAGIDLALAWLAMYRRHREALLKLAAERRGVAPEVLRARPVSGEIDYTELIREHMARYPKIRAALAK